MLYTLTQSFPKEELYGLVSQMRRSSISVSSNIAEGCGYTSTKQLVRFLEIAMGSICELESQLYVSKDLKYVEQNTFIKVADRLVQTRKMLYRFIQSNRS